jgi:hypothetical protein
VAQNKLPPALNFLCFLTPRGSLILGVVADSLTANSPAKQQLETFVESTSTLMLSSAPSMFPLSNRRRQVLASKRHHQRPGNCHTRHSTSRKYGATASSGGDNSDPPSPLTDPGGTSAEERQQRQAGTGVPMDKSPEPPSETASETESSEYEMLPMGLSMQRGVIRTWMCGLGTV